MLEKNLYRWGEILDFEAGAYVGFWGEVGTGC